MSGVHGTPDLCFYLVDEDAIEDVQGAQHDCDSVCVRVYSLATASMRVSSLPGCSVPPLLAALYSGTPPSIEHCTESAFSQTAHGLSTQCSRGLHAGAE